MIALLLNIIMFSKFSLTGVAILREKKEVCVHQVKSGIRVVIKRSVEQVYHCNTHIILWFRFPLIAEVLVG